MMGKARFSGEAPRWAGLSTAIREAAFLLGLDLSLECHTHLIWETVFVTVTGDDDKILRFANWLKDAADEYNA
jgi:hypothetical protein